MQEFNKKQRNSLLSSFKVPQNIYYPRYLVNIQLIRIGTTIQRHSSSRSEKVFRKDFVVENQQNLKRKTCNNQRTHIVHVYIACISRVSGVLKSRAVWSREKESTDICLGATKEKKNTKHRWCQKSRADRPNDRWIAMRMQI